MESSAQTSSTMLPHLRDDLELFQGTDQLDGTPTWVIHDSCRQLFFTAGWVEVEMLGRWHVGDVDALIDAVNEETTAHIDAERVQDLIEFLFQNELLRIQGKEVRQVFHQRVALKKMKSLKWLLKNYLFFRVPLVRPDRLLSALLPLNKFFINYYFATFILLAGFFGLFVVSRQWDEFIGTFQYLTTPLGLTLSFVALAGTKILHEMGHAMLAKRYGLNVPTMGVAFLVMWPVLYTDTTDIWKLRSRRKRINVAAGGIIVELSLALLATFAWAILPDGGLRSMSFVVAAIAWISSLLINLNPFMRFDGYYLLSEVLNIPNLEARSFALAKWRLRRFLFGIDLPPPEKFSPKMQRGLVVYAYLVWIYRFFLFLGIAFLVYHLFFKLAGIFLFIVEIAWFIVGPMYREIKEWYKLKSMLQWNLNIIRTFALIAIAFVFLLLPIPVTLHLPAILKADSFNRIYTPFDAMVNIIAVDNGQLVDAGEKLFELQSPKLRYAISQAKDEIAFISLQQKMTAGSAKRRMQQDVLFNKKLEAQHQLAALEQKYEKRFVTAPVAGRIVDVDPFLHQQRWLEEGSRLALLINDKRLAIKSYIKEEDLRHIQIGMAGRFISNLPETDSVDVILTHIDEARVMEMSEPYLASIHGGPIVTTMTEQGQLVPEETYYQLQWHVAAEEKPVTLKLIETGEVYVKSGAYIKVYSLFDHVLSVLIRESGF